MLHVLEAYARGVDLNHVFTSSEAADVFKDAHGRIDKPGSKGAATAKHSAGCTLLQAACKTGNVAVLEVLV